MISHRHLVVAATYVLATGCAATRSGTGGMMPMRGMMMGGMPQGGMAQGGMAHDTTAMPPFSTMLRRTDSLVLRAARLIGDTAAAMPHAMAMEHAAGESPQAMAGSVHAMAKSLRALLQQMDAMHRTGTPMDHGAGSPMMDLHRSANAILGEMEKAVQALDGLRKGSARGQE